MIDLTKLMTATAGAPDHLQLPKPYLAVCCYLLVVFMLSSIPAYAHKLTLFAAVDGKRIEGTVNLDHAHAHVHDLTITVQDAAGQSLAQLTHTAAGEFAYIVQAPIDHVIIVDSADGHRAEWRVTAAELAPGFPERLGNDASHSSMVSAEVDAAMLSANAVVEARIEQAVARQLKPLREELQAVKNTIYFRDIVGGLGYIFGLMGLALAWRSRQASAAE